MFELLAFLVIAAIAIAVVGAIAALIVLIACSILQIVERSKKWIWITSSE